ncbi:hypothetical protein BJ973_001315 [Actinoplanes tereljensis]|uniref:Uncharacterized protein n=1 Tax=Paractinoplanes tereljensis TaxID=571912 RepID=A0A919TT08_9ACTN|nr:hypothetical protein [Actinoplanes tereljensis]GIF20779.1 hypothetical protein Ate02nite_35090 [Actinoplanes tereljensis]
MPQRRLTALTIALVATAGLTAGCAIEISPEAAGVPVPFSLAPTPSASAGVPAYTCTAAYKILTDGAVQLAGVAGSSSDSAKQKMRDTFTDMAGKLDKEAALTSGPELKQALSAVSSDLTAAAQQPDPKAYVNGGFETVGQKLDDACADA